MRVLLVEDEAALLALISEALDDEGCDVATARDASQALATLAGEARFDVIVSDISMPGDVSGIDLATRAVELQPDARIILVSGLAKAQLPPLPGHVSFLPKPYRLGELLSRIQDAGGAAA